MSPIEIRNLAWRDILPNLGERQREIYESWQAACRELGPLTTRDLADLADRDILAVRPRTTELVQAGLLVCAGMRHREGLYRPATLDEWSAARPATQLELCPSRPSSSS